MRADTCGTLPREAPGGSCQCQLTVPTAPRETCCRDSCSVEANAEAWRCQVIFCMPTHAHVYCVVTSDMLLTGDQEAQSGRMRIRLYMNLLICLFISEKDFRKGVHKVT